MLCFDVYVNGVRRCRAGVGAAGVVTAIVSWVGKDRGSSSKRRIQSSGVADVDVGGLHGPKRGKTAHPRWLHQSINVGDEVLVRVVHADTPDAPCHVDTYSEEQVQERERAYYEQLKQKFERNPKVSSTSKSKLRKAPGGYVAESVPVAKGKRSTTTKSSVRSR